MDGFADLSRTNCAACARPTPNHLLAQIRRFQIIGIDAALIILLARQAWLIALGTKLFDELDQTIDQPATAADDVKPALVLMFFEDSVEIGFQLVFMHKPPLRFL